MNSDQITKLFNRIAGKQLTEQDKTTLLEWLPKAPIGIVYGERAVAITGDINDVIIITGDNNIVYKGPDAEAIRAIVDEITITRRPRSLLSRTDFGARVEHNCLTGFQAPLVGRQTLLLKIETLFSNGTNLIVLHGSGGVRKTRLLLELANIVPENVHLWYIRTEAESIEWEINNLDPNVHYVLVIDDAHRFSHMSQIRELLVNPQMVERVTILLVTRTVFKDSVVNKLSPPINIKLADVDVQPLSNAEIDEILRNGPFLLVSEDVRNAILIIAEGNPLFAGIAALLVGRGESLIGLNRDQVLVRYLSEIIRNLADAGYGNQYIAFIEIMSALGSIDLNNQVLHERICEVIGLNHIDTERMILRMVDTGLVERYWMTLKLTSEVLSDHILIYHFFDPSTRQADFKAQIIEPFFEIKPKEILGNLSRAEIKFESTEVGTILGQKLTEILALVKDGSNQERLTILEWLENVAYFRPDDLLAILATVIEGQEKPTEKFQDRLWGPIDFTHAMVLNKSVALLEHIIYRGDLRDAIKYFYSLATYQPENQIYKPVRENAQKVLLDIAGYQLRKPFNIQLVLLGSIDDWVRKSLEKDLKWIVEVIQPMLKMEYMSTETDLTKAHSILIKEGFLNPTTVLREIRVCALDTIIRIYSVAGSLVSRLKIIRALEDAAPAFMTNTKVPQELFDWLMPDWGKVAKFYLEVVIPGEELPVIDVIEKWAHSERRFGGMFPKAIILLQEQIAGHERYQLYRLLIGWYRWDTYKFGGWQDAEEKRKQEGYKYLLTITPATIDKTIDDLVIIVRQAREAGENGFMYLNILLKSLGENQPTLACCLVDRTILEDLELKYHLGDVVAGLMIGDPTKAWVYIKKWIESDNPNLWQSVAESYRYSSWSDLQTRDWDILRELAQKGNGGVDHRILSYIFQFAPINNGLATELLREWANRGNEALLTHLADVLNWPNGKGDGWAIEFNDPQVYLEIIQNFERLSSLGNHSEGILKRLAEVEPGLVIDFIEKRIINASMLGSEAPGFHAVPLGIFSAFDNIRMSSQYLDILRRVRDWMLRDDGWFRRTTPDVLKSISGGLGAPLYRVLAEWVQSGEAKKLQALSFILRDFNIGNSFYDLSREIIIQTDDEKTLDSISAAIHTTPGVISGPMSIFTQQRIDEVAPWLKDENLRVRRFGQKVILELQKDFEREKAEEAYEDRNWR